MTFEKNIGGPQPVAGEAGVQEFVTAAPPGEGWRWYGGENDGRLHGLLRITRLSLDCTGKRDLGDFEHNMGIVTRDFQPRPAYRAYAVMTQLLKGSRAGRVLEVEPGVLAYEFTPAGGSRVVALWSISGDRTVSLPSYKPQTATGLMGDVETG